MTTIGLSGNLFPVPIAFDATAQLPSIQLLYLGRDPEDVVPAARVPYPTAYSLAPNLKELDVAGLFYVRIISCTHCSTHQRTGHLHVSKLERPHGAGGRLQRLCRPAVPPVHGKAGL